MDEDFKQLGVETVLKAYHLLRETHWKIVKVTSSNDVIYAIEKPIGKVYKLRAKVQYPAEKLLHELFDKIENFPDWNPTLLKSKIVKRIDSHTDISYSVSSPGGGGLVKSRDFVNLRCWKLMNDSKVSENINNHKPRVQNQKESVNDIKDSKDQATNELKNVFVSAAISLDFPQIPPIQQYIRGENIVSCWAFWPIEAEEDSCIFEWLMCIDLKGSLPRYVLNTAFVSLMTDYMTHLRSRIQVLNVERKNQTDAVDRFSV